MHAKPSFVHRLQAAKTASSRTSAQSNGPRAQNNGLRVSSVSLFAMANRRAQAAARGTTPSSLDSCFQHGNSIWLFRLRLFLSFCGDIVNENIVKSAIKYNISHVFKHTALKLNVKSSKYTDIHNDSKEIVS